MSKKEHFNTVQRKYLQRETTLSPAGESVAEAPKFNKIQSRYLDGINASPDGTAGDGALTVPSAAVISNRCAHR